MMRTLSVVCLATMLLAGSVFASTPGTDTHATVQQLQIMEGAYKLTKGRILRLSAVQNRLYAEVNGHDRTELVATSENVFASKDGTIKVTYKPETETSLEQISVAFAHEGRVSLAHAFTERDWRSVWASR
jgi:hypothetical protein